MENTLKDSGGLFEKGLKGRPRYVLGSEPQYNGIHKENETQWHENNSGGLLMANNSDGLHIMIG